VIAIKDLAEQIGIHITKRKVLQSIPIFGAIIGGSVNSWFIKEIGWGVGGYFRNSG